MMVLAKRYAEDSFAVLREWHAELKDLLHDEGCQLTPHQQEDLNKGLPVWLSGTLCIKHTIQDHVRDVMKHPGE